MTANLCPNCRDTGYGQATGGVTPCARCPIGQAIIEGRRKRHERKERRKVARKPALADTRHFQEKGDL